MGVPPMPLHVVSTRQRHLRSGLPVQYPPTLAEARDAIAARRRADAVFMLTQVVMAVVLLFMGFGCWKRGGM